MAEYGSSRRKQIREPPSVPFLWEDKPGVAKKDWRPMVSSVTTIPALPSPVKLIASVPFVWEEKPGKPLSCFSMESPPMTPLVNLVSLPSPPMYSQWHNEHMFNNEEGGPDDENYDTELSLMILPENHVSLPSPPMDSLWHNGHMFTGEDWHGSHEDGIFNLDLQSFSFETDDSFNSAHSLSANCLVSTLALSAAVPVLETSGTVKNNAQSETPSSPASETDTSTSSYATGISSLAGSSILECLFPLYATHSFPRNESCPEESYYLSPTEQNSRSSNLGKDDDDFNPRRPATLGELIMMSRRKSCQRKAVQMAKRNLSMEFMNQKAFGCNIFGAGINLLEGLQRKRHHLLKLL
ncbi:hydroxyproline-rich glycoprotein family protein [Euphorbia peplus]|nr:hydroxyproline-rich glycoprotein family protein [Euphorbia peplus]